MGTVTPQTEAYGEIVVINTPRTEEMVTTKVAMAAPVAAKSVTAKVAAAPRAAYGLVEAEVREYFQDAPVMIQIARCESSFNQYDRNGNVLKNPHSTAKGAFQIMESLHTAKAANLGYDILTLEGNMGYARYLYNQQGTTPWNASKHCWGNTLAMN